MLSTTTLGEQHVAELANANLESVGLKGQAQSLHVDAEGKEQAVDSRHGGLGERLGEAFK